MAKKVKPVANKPVVKKEATKKVTMTLKQAEMIQKALLKTKKTFKFLDKKILEA